MLSIDDKDGFGLYRYDLGVKGQVQVYLNSVLVEYRTPLTLSIFGTTVAYVV